MSLNMSSTQRLLWSRLESFTIGDPAASLGFAQRLARDNGWPLEFARRTIDEYKRFLFLAVEAGHPVTPSDEVDQAWHLHLVYTESYWNELCREILPRPLHHGPTKGGKREGDKFGDWYSRTLRSYERYFGGPAPADIWPDAAIRFGRAAQFRRINTADHWVIHKKKPRWAATLAACSAVPFLLIGCGLGLAQGGDSIGSAMAFVLLVLLVVGVVAVALASKGRGRRREQGGSGGCGGFTWLGGLGCGSDHGASGCGAHHGGHGGHSGCGSDAGASGCGGGGCGGGGCGGS